MWVEKKVKNKEPGDLGIQGLIQRTRQKPN
jgi:hypothetical protein